MVTETRQIDAELLNRVGKNVHRGRDLLQEGWERFENGDPAAGRALLSDANEAVQAAHISLLGEGVEDLYDAPASVFDIPLDKLDTPTTRRFLAAVKEVQRLAEEVDRERGHVTPQGHCCGWADRADDLYYQVRAEVEGAAGRD